MDILALLNPYRWLLLAGLIGSMVLGYFAWESHQRGIGDARTTVKYEAILRQIKADGIVALDAEKGKVVAAEKKLQDFHFEQELTNANNQKTVLGLKNTVAGLRNSAGRLRDPNATTGCGSGSAQAPNTASPIDRATDRAQAGGLLSRQISDLFVDITSEADTINIAYAACRADSIKLRETLALQ